MKFRKKFHFNHLHCVIHISLASFLKKILAFLEPNQINFTVKFTPTKDNAFADTSDVDFGYKIGEN